MDERKAEALRELLRELCRRGRLATLLSLPLADNVDVRIAGRCEGVSTCRINYLPPSAYHEGCKCARQTQ